jgi:hypothetical protein
MKQEAPWDILKISQDATLQEIEIARRTLAAKYHPDKASNTTPEIREMAAERTKQINAAADEMVRTIRARTNASRANQSRSPQDERHASGAKQTTYHPGASKPFLQILGMIALVGFILLGFFHHLYLGRVLGFRPQPVASPTPGTMSGYRSQPTSSPSPSAPEPDAQILKQACGDQVIQVTARVDHKTANLVIPITIKNSVKDQVREVLRALQSSEITDDSGKPCRPSAVQYPDRDVQIDFPLLGTGIYTRGDKGGIIGFHQTQVVELVYPCSYISHPTNVKALDLPTTVWTANSNCPPLHFQNIPIREPDPNAPIWSWYVADAHFEVQKARINLENGTLVIPLAIKNFGKEDQTMSIQFTLTAGTKGETCQPSRIQYPDGEVISDRVPCSAGGALTQIELVCESCASVQKGKKLAGVDLSLVFGPSQWSNQHEGAAHFKNIPVTTDSPSPVADDFWRGYYAAQKAKKRPSNRPALR